MARPTRFCTRRALASAAVSLRLSLTEVLLDGQVEQVPRLVQQCAGVLVVMPGRLDEGLVAIAGHALDERDARDDRGQGRVHGVTRLTIMPTPNSRATAMVNASRSRTVSTASG